VQEPNRSKGQHRYVTPVYHITSGAHQNIGQAVRMQASSPDSLHQHWDLAHHENRRLNVFPLKIPSLKERGDDIILLASAFAEHCAQKLGQILEPLSEELKGQLKAYDWPGNVRELQNVIERAVITCRNGHLNLSRALPEAGGNGEGADASDTDDSKRVMTIQELQEIERTNIMRALKTTGWRVAGENGAARLLDIPPSTLSSRMKALGIARSR